MKVEIKYNINNDLEYIISKYDYLKIYSDTNGWICGYEDNELNYILPFVEKKKWIFRYIQFMSDTIYLKNNKNEKQFLNLVIKKLKNTNIDFISQPKTNAVFNTYPNGAIFAKFGSYIIDLSLSEEQLWKNIHSKHKNVIKRAIKNGVKVKIGIENFDDVYEVINQTLQRNNMNMINNNILYEFVKKFKNNSLICGSYLDENIQSGAIILFDKYKGYYFWGGTSENLSLGANNLLHWEIIKELKNQKVLYYDFVGARIDPKDNRLKGIQRFKNRFGAQMKQGYLWKYPLNPIKYYMFNFLYKLKMKKGDIIEQENNSNI